MKLTLLVQLTSEPCQQTGFILAFPTHALVVHGNAPVLVDLHVIRMHHIVH